MHKLKLLSKTFLKETYLIIRRYLDGKGMEKSASFRIIAFECDTASISINKSQILNLRFTSSPLFLKGRLLSTKLLLYRLYFVINISLIKWRGVMI